MKPILFRSSYPKPAEDYLDWVRAAYPKGCFNIYKGEGALGPEIQVVQES